ncbi:biopolymer transporter ExbD [bacterium]|nr:biopolymer transporter ExbD [bacterium]
MASAGPMPSSGGRRSLDAEINLVPFIDLLSVCICFLLMTAVWTQISTVQVKQSHGTEAGEAGEYELNVQFSNAQTVALELKKKGRAYKKASFKADDFKALLGSMDGQITTWLAPLVKDPAAPSPVTAAMVTPKADVTYGDLVSTMDVLRKHQIVNLGVVPVAEGK